MPELLVHHRFSGPPSSGNGGYTAGALAVHLEAPVVSVSLQAPPPLDTPMPVQIVDGVVVAGLDGGPVARAEAGELSQTTTTPVSAEEARAAEASYVGHHTHPFPTCFVCGTEREDGLRIFPGPVADQDGLSRLAGTWVPDESLADDLVAVTWSALDCTGGWAGGLGERMMVLARMTAQIDELPRIGEEYVVLGLGRGTEGRKSHTSTALLDPDGRVIGRAEHLWIAVDPALFG